MRSAMSGFCFIIPPASKNIILHLGATLSENQALVPSNTFTLVSDTRASSAAEEVIGSSALEHAAPLTPHRTDSTPRSLRRRRHWTSERGVVESRGVTMTTDLEQGGGETAVRPEYGSFSSGRQKRCWTRPRTPLEQMLLTLLFVMSALCAVLVILLTRKPNAVPLFFENAEIKSQCSSSEQQRICTNEACVQAAAAFLESIDLSTNPCDDFYQFACGRWHRHHTLPSDKSHYDTFAKMKDKLKANIKVLLEEPIKESDSNATIKAKHLYTSCMNETLIEARKEQPLLDLLQDFGDWPVISANWSEEDFNWVRVTALLRQLTNNIFISHGVGPDPKNSSLYILQLEQAELGLPSRDYYLQNTEQMEAYLRFMTDIAILLGASPEKAREEMIDVLNFEIQLANITVPIEERRNLSAVYKKITLQELQEAVPDVNWTLYFSLVMPVEINGSEEIVVYALDYLKNMSLLVESTPKRVVANYLLWRFVSNRASNLDRRFLETTQNYMQALIGTLSISPRWRTCTVFVNKVMGMAVGALFIRSHFNEKSKERAEEMISDIKNAFLEMLDDVEWMDNETYKVAREKAELMTQKIGYPEYIHSPLELDKDYDGVDINPDTYFENVLNALRENALRDQLKLRTPVDKTQWVTPPAVVNAYYTRSKNFITFPAGILQPPLYHWNYPRSLNYGGIGVVIGHEITHGFDDKGRQFDQHGNLKQWWHPKALARFQEKAECMVQQYSKYIMPDIEMKVNGINTQGENIADNGGIKQAFRAYKEWERDHGPEDLLPGINLTHHQLFFLNYAQIWCGVMRPEAAENTIRTALHSPGIFRVVGVLSNLREFSEAYNCPLGSAMNPVDKCEVW